MLSSRKLKYLLAAAVMTLAFAAMQSPANAEFAAPLLQCSQVTQPGGTLATCAAVQDPFKRGSVRIDDAGRMEVALVGAAASATYAIQFRSPDGTHTASVDSLNTDTNGNGHMSKDKEFAKGKAGAGIVVLSRNGVTGDQFVSGFTVQHPGPDFRGGLIKCADVNVPAALGAACGGDSLKSGSFDLESDDGDLTIAVRGAAANQTYPAVIRAPNGTTQLALGSVSTNGMGNGTLTQNPSSIAPGTIGAGTLVLQRGGIDQFLGGFKITRTPGPKTASKSSLVRCIDVNLPTTLACGGTDPLDHGSAMIDQSGKVSANLNGAAQNTVYKVFFRPLDNSGDVDTGVTLMTDPNGNAQGHGTFAAASGKTGSGSFVVKGGGFDQFVPGFQVK